MRKSVIVNKKTILNIISILLVWILSSGVTNNFDYESFRLSYLNLIPTTFELSYKFLENLFFEIGFSFNMFKLVLMTFSLLLISRTVNKFIEKENRWVFYLLYLIFPLAFYAYSLRSAIGLSIVVYAFPFLLEKGIRYKVYYFLLIILAYTFHFSMVFFIVFLIIPFLNRRERVGFKKFVYIMILLAIIILTLSDSLLNGTVDFFYNYVFIPLKISDSKSTYFNLSVRYGYLYFAVSHLSFVVVLYYSRYLINIESKFVKDNRNDFVKNRKFINFVLMASILLLILIPIIRVNTEISRLYKGFAPIFLISIISSLGIIKHNKLGKRNLRILVFFSMVINFYVYVYPYLEETFIPMFRDNWLIGL